MKSFIDSQELRDMGSILSELRSVDEAKLSAKQRFDTYARDYGIQDHGMQSRTEAEKVIRHIFTVEKDLTSEQMKSLVDKGLFAEGIKQNEAALMQSYVRFANHNGEEMNSDWRKRTTENAKILSKSFDNNGFVQRFDYRSFINKNLK